MRECQICGIQGESRICFVCFCQLEAMNEERRILEFENNRILHLEEEEE